MIYFKMSSGTVHNVAISAFILLVMLGCAPTISNKYVATVLDKTDNKLVDEVLIKVTPHVDIMVRGDCYPDNGPCRVVILWFYPTVDSVKFSDGAFVALDVHNYDIKYGATPTGLEDLSCRGKKCDKKWFDKETGKVEVVWLGDYPPKEFRLVMPKLNVNGVEKEIPVIYFKHVQVPELTPILINY